MLIEPPLTFFKHDKITDEIITVPMQNTFCHPFGESLSNRTKGEVLEVAKILKNDTLSDYYLTLGTADDLDSFTLIKKGKNDEMDKEILIGEMIRTGHELKKLKSTKLGRKIYNFDNTPCLSIMEIWQPENGMSDEEKKEYKKNINMITDMVLALFSQRESKNK